MFEDKNNPFNPANRPSDGQEGPDQPTIDVTGRPTDADQDPVTDRVLPRTHVRVNDQRQRPRTEKPKKNTGMTRFIATVLIALIAGGVGGWAGNALFNHQAQTGGTILAGPKATATKTVSSTGTFSVADIAEKVVPAVVGVNNFGKQTTIFGQTGEMNQASGSGVIIREDGTMVTNYHVISGSTRLTVTLADGSTKNAKVIGYDQESDLAVLDIEGSGYPTVDIGDSDALRVGQLAVAVGNPLGQTFSQTVTDGIISGINREIQMGNQTYNLLQTNCAINQGNSGGALVDGQGKLIGINSVKVQAEGVEGLGFAIPVNNVMRIVDKIEKGESPSAQPFVGISGYSLTAEMAAQLNIDQESGLLVVQTVEGSPADQAGILPGDIITGVDGKTLKGYEDLQAILKNHKAGDTLTLDVMRRNKEGQAKITLGEQTGVPA
ncbi:S1C family serine protease [Peptococcus simiae]|uniref:S1C family serine protease n=1 Tax=Peptococcus simiae TaxID=1643805 RepID=UPI00397EC862